MKTVGSILKKAREGKNLSHKEIFKAIKIHPRFLKALEDGSWDSFSSGVHAKGFLKNYASFLGLDVNEVLAFFRREYDEKKNGPSIKNLIKPLSGPRVVITPGLVLTAATALFVLLFFGYVIYQYRSFAGAPVLIIDQPRTDQTVSESLLNVVGRTDPDAIVSLNGQEITTGEKGTFSAHITLAEGANTLNFVAENKLGKKNTVTRTVVVRPPEPVAAGPGEVAATESAQPKPDQGLKIEIRVGPNASWIKVEADGNTVFEGLAAAGVTKKFNAKEKIFLRTGNAGSTKVFVNGEEQEPLGEEGQVAEHDYAK
jgi:cytoskeletal protein RodZ